MTVKTKLAAKKSAAKVATKQTKRPPREATKTKKAAKR
jgi:hypothetical protein